MTEDHHRNCFLPDFDSFGFDQHKREPSQANEEVETFSLCQPPSMFSAFHALSRRVGRIVLVLLIQVICEPSLLRSTLGNDETSDWDRWNPTPVTEDQRESLKQQMLRAGLAASRRDARIFLPHTENHLQLESISEQRPPFGLILSNADISHDQLSTLPSCHGLYSLTLRGFQDGTMAAEKAGRQPNLRYLSLSESSIRDEDLSQLVNLKFLETLDLRGTQVLGPGLNVLKTLPSLRLVEVDLTEDQFRSLANCDLLHLLMIATGADNSEVFHDREIVEMELNGFYGFRVTDTMLHDLRKLKSLRRLSLISTDVTSEGLEALLELPQLNHLNLEQSKIDDAACQTIAPALKLRCLILNQTKISSTGLAHLILNPCLQELHLNRCRLDDGCLAVLGALPALEKLEIGDTQIQFQNAPQNNLFRRLQHLNMNGSQVTDRGLESISRLPDLKWLDLTRCQISTAGLKSLAACPKLEVLYLNLTGISDDALVHLGSIETLEVLSLNSTGVTDAGVKHLSKSSNLKSLILFGTKVSPEAVQRLQSQLPNCEIVR